MRHGSSQATRRRGLAVWLAALALLGIIMLGALELFFRAFPQFMPPAMQFRLHDQAIAANELKSVPNEEMGYLWEPEISARFEGWNFAFHYATDEHGFRNEGPWPERAHIVVIGDSQAFGFGVDDGDEWARRLDQLLPGAEVVNLGLIGAAPQQLPGVYEAYGAPLQPAVVVVALFPPNAIGIGNLFHEWQAAGRPGRFDERRMGGHGPHGQGVLDTIKGWLRGSYAVLGIYYGLRQLTGTTDMITVSYGEQGELRLVPSRYGDTAAVAAPGRPEFERIIATLERLHGKVRASGAEMLVVAFPTKEEVLLPMLGEQPNRLVAPFIAELEGRGVATLDLTPYLRERAAAGEKLFFEIDLHPDPAGQQLIAEVLSEHLEPRLADAGLSSEPTPAAEGKPASRF